MVVLVEKLNQRAPIIRIDERAVTTTGIILMVINARLAHRFELFVDDQLNVDIRIIVQLDRLAHVEQFRVFVRQKIANFRLSRRRQR